MDSAPPAYAEAAAVAGLVPRLLTAHVETAEPVCEDAAASAIERCADQLLRWHDVLVGVRAPQDPSEHVETTGEGVPSHGSSALAGALRAGNVPGSPPSLELASHELLHASRRVRQIAGAPSVRDDCRSGGLHIADQLDRLGAAFQTHADLLRGETRRLDRIRRQYADSDRLEEDTAQVLGRVVRAEHALARLALGTLPQ